MQREKILEMIVSPKYKPLNIEEVSSLWKLSEIEKIDLKKNVRELINEGKLLEIKKGKLVLHFNNAEEFQQMLNALNLDQLA